MILFANCLLLPCVITFKTMKLKSYEIRRKTSFAFSIFLNKTKGPI